MIHPNRPILIVLILITGWLKAGAQSEGWVDLRSMRTSEKALALDGEWEFYPNRLLTDFYEQEKVMVEFPDVWRSNEKIDFGTYRIRILLAAGSRAKNFAMEVPHFFSSYALYINGTLMGKNGTPGTTKASTTPLWKPATYFFTCPSDTLDVVLQVANFYHNIGGTRKSIRIAEAPVLEYKQRFIKVTDYGLITILMVISVASLCLYILKPEHRSPFLFLTLFAISWGLHSVSSNQYRILDWVDISWDWLVKLEHLTIFFTIITALLFIASLFPEDFKSKPLKILFLGLGTLFSIFAVLTEPVTFTSYLLLYMMVAVCLIVYVILLISKAFIYERGGSSIMMITIFVGSLTFGYVVLSYLGILEIDMLIYNFSFIILYPLLTISMFVRLQKMGSHEENDMLTFDQLYKDKSKG